MCAQRAGAHQTDSRCYPLPAAMSDDREENRRRLTPTFETSPSVALGDLGVGIKPQPS